MKNQQANTKNKYDAMYLLVKIKKVDKKEGAELERVVFKPETELHQMEMEPKTRVMKLSLVLLLVTALGAVEITDLALPGCNSTCGNTPIPYPFGAGNSSVTGKSCYLENQVNGFSVWCNESGKVLNLADSPIVNITLDGQLELVNPSQHTKVCFNNNSKVSFEFGSKFPVSSKRNKFVTIGCDIFGYLTAYNYSDGGGSSDKKSTTGCLARCDSQNTLAAISDGICNGIGCCEVDVPTVTQWYAEIQPISLFEIIRGVAGANRDINCSYSFIAKEGSYNHSIKQLAETKEFKYERFPVVMDWFVGNETCEEAARKSETYVCTNNTDCKDRDTGRGYLCTCKQGYEGNPYHPNGCRDIDECKTSNNTCISEHNCVNTVGSYECFCPKGESGNGTKEGGCHPKNILTKAVIGVLTGLGSIILFLLLWWLVKVVRRRVIEKRKEKYYKKNGGLLLEQKLSSGGVNVDKAKLFSLNNLEKATDHFNTDRVLGKGGQGTVYKGMLPDGQIVAVKKFKVEGNVDEFINEFVILSQINHRNVVKLLGCCLEDEIPLLVYEFIPNGTLSEYLHQQHEDLPMTWAVRLRIATEVAGSLFYLHSAASQPIYHRDIKSTNILLDEKYRAKVADFGASRMVSSEDTHLTTAVLGTFGYLDPEYFQTSQFTEKSDVYSFAVVLVELLTGEKAISSTISQETKSLATYFLCYMKENRLFDIIDKRLKKEGEKNHIIAVANLAFRCLDLNGKNRPAMKEVAMELERIRKLESKSSELQNYEEIDPYENKNYHQWTTYSSTNTGSTQSSITSSSSSSEVMPILNTSGHTFF